MTKFPTQPELRSVPATPDEREQIGKDWLYELLKDFRYEDEDEGFRIEVKRGFRHDGGSVPRLAWTLSGLTPTGKSSAAYLIHDWLYRYDGKLPDRLHYIRIERKDRTAWMKSPGVFNRAQADRLLRKIMRLSGVRWSQRWAAYYAVRLGGRRW